MAFGNKYEYESRVDFWDNVYGGVITLLWSLVLVVPLLGFKMGSMKEEVLHEAAVAVVDKYSVISSADVIKAVLY